jgi:uncharacterized phage-associated protein
MISSIDGGMRSTIPTVGISYTIAAAAAIASEIRRFSPWSVTVNRGNRIERTI